jgi:lipoyl(octanoyl) transferase
MEFDRELFWEQEKGKTSVTLRIYSWQPRCISLGYSQEIDEEIDLAGAARLGYDVVKRPTGGGIVFHNEAEVTYSLVTSIDDPLFPKGLIASYKIISEAIVIGLKRLGIKAEVKQTRDSRPAIRDTLCFSYPTEYEIVVDGRKLVGSAQKRGKNAMLQQGSIFVRQPDPAVFSVLKQPFARPKAVSLEELLGRQVSFDELKEALVAGFRDGLGLGCRLAGPGRD